MLTIVRSSAGLTGTNAFAAILQSGTSSDEHALDQNGAMKTARRNSRERVAGTRSSSGQEVGDGNRLGGVP